MSGNVILAGVCLAVGAAQAQVLDLSITDADEIAAICGGDAGLGEPLYIQHCAQCHEIGEEAINGAGPHLYAVFGRTPGSVEDYAYSGALAAAVSEGWIWERETLHGYVTDPAHYLPGTSSTFDGIADEQTRQHLFTYLRTVTTPPPPLRGTVVVPPEVLAMQGDIPYGEYLASGCVGCHQLNGQTAGVPAITGWPTEPFITAMYEYRLGSRPNQTMVNLSRRLSDEEIVALAAYFETFR